MLYGNSLLNQFFSLQPSQGDPTPWKTSSRVWTYPAHPRTPADLEYFLAMPETQGINQKPLENIHTYIYIACISEHID
jgi:hypothetical protein